jgi:hypothetical protein
VSAQSESQGRAGFHRSYRFLSWPERFKRRGMKDRVLFVRHLVVPPLLAWRCIFSKHIRKPLLRLAKFFLAAVRKL